MLAARSLLRRDTVAENHGETATGGAVVVHEADVAVDAVRSADDEVAAVGHPAEFVADDVGRRVRGAGDPVRRAARVLCGQP